jgi:hypothetical protein
VFLQHQCCTRFLKVAVTVACIKADPGVLRLLLLLPRQLMPYLVDGHARAAAGYMITVVQKQSVVVEVYCARLLKAWRSAWCGALAVLQRGRVNVS